MLNLFFYQTPLAFYSAFKEFYLRTNLKQVRTLSMTILVIAFICRIVAIVYHQEIVNIQSYQAHSLNNWIQLSGAFLFYIFSSLLLKGQFNKPLVCKATVLAFVLFVLLMTMSVSYVVSTYNTKNTLTMFLIGIVIVSLFFVLEDREIAVISIVVVIIFISSVAFPKITFQDKMMNTFAALILGFVLVVSSRYNYYFKSQYFVRLKQLEEKHQEVERLNIQKGEILSFVAHDLRNPLNNIEALSSLILLEDEDQEKASMINTAAKQAKTIINDLLESVKVDKPLETVKMELNLYLSKIIEKWKTNEQVILTFEGIRSPVLANINPSKLERVMDNMISNAIKFSPIDKPILITLADFTTHICITVKDHGIGIPSNLLPFLFDQFSAAGRKGLSGQSSVGLGLHISKKIVEQHQGKLTVQSEENKGTTFTILLPSF